MFEVKKILNGDKLTFDLNGTLNSVSSPDFKELAFAEIDNCKTMVLDFANLKYVASAGLRVVLELHKALSSKDKRLELLNVDDGTMEILDATGLTRFLNIK